MGFSIICFLFADARNSKEAFKEIQNQEWLKAITKQCEFGLLILTLSCDCVCGFSDRWVGGNKQDWFNPYFYFYFYFLIDMVEKVKHQNKII